MRLRNALVFMMCSAFAVGCFGRKAIRGRQIEALPPIAVQPITIEAEAACTVDVVQAANRSHEALVDELERQGFKIAKGNEGEKLTASMSGTVNRCRDTSGVNTVTVSVSDENGRRIGDVRRRYAIRTDSEANTGASLMNQSRSLVTLMKREKHMRVYARDRLAAGPTRVAANDTRTESPAEAPVEEPAKVSEPAEAPKATPVSNNMGDDIKKGPPFNRDWIVAVMEVKDINAGDRKRAVGDDVIRNLGTQLRSFIAERGAKTVDRSAQNRALQEQVASIKKDSYKSCYDDSCQVELGKALAASHILRSQITRFGSRCVLNAELFDLRREVTIAASSSRGDCEPEGFLRMSQEVAYKLEARD